MDDNQKLAGIYFGQMPKSGMVGTVCLGGESLRKIEDLHDGMYTGALNYLD